MHRTQLAPPPKAGIIPPLFLVYTSARRCWRLTFADNGAAQRWHQLLQELRLSHDPGLEVTAPSEEPPGQPPPPAMAPLWTLRLQIPGPGGC